MQFWVCVCDDFWFFFGHKKSRKLIKYHNQGGLTQICILQFEMKRSYSPSNYLKFILR